VTSRSHTRVGRPFLAASFWFFGHPEVYIAILPGMGVTSQLLSTFARKPIYGYRVMVYAIFAIGLMGFFVWGHHMFVSGLSPMSALVFSLLTFDDWSSICREDFQLVGNFVGGENIAFAPPLFMPLVLFLCLSRVGLQDFSSGRHPLTCPCTIPISRWSFPSDYGCSCHLRDLRRDLLLVSQDVWAHDE